MDAELKKQGTERRRVWEASEILAEKVRNRKTVAGTMLSEFSTPNVIRILRTAGFEFVIVDCEHGYFDYSQLAALIAVGAGFGIPVLVRVPGSGREFITKVLDMGASGILVPMVSSRQDAEKIVSFAKYAPVGKRGISTQRAHTDYSPPPLGEYMPQANQRTVVMVQIETKEGFESVEEIAAVEGIDVIMTGPNDLAADLGMPGEITAPEMMGAVEKICAAAGKFGKPGGIITSSQNMIRKCRGIGMTVFSCNSEVGMLLVGARNTCAAVRESVKIGK